MWEGVGAQRKRPHKPNHSGGLYAGPTPARLMRLSAGLSTRGGVLGQQHGITHALKLVAKCKAWCGCMACTGEMKTRTAPARLVQSLACWSERLEGARCLRIDMLLRCCPPHTPNGCKSTARQAELSLEPRWRKGRHEGEAMSGGEESGGVARPCVSFDDTSPLAATLPSSPPICHSSVFPPWTDQPIRPIDSDISPLTRTLFLDLATGRVWSDGLLLTSCLWVVVSKHCSSHHTTCGPPAGCEHDDAAVL